TDPSVLRPRRGCRPRRPAGAAGHHPDRPGGEAVAAQILPGGARGAGGARRIPGGRALWRFFFSTAGRVGREPGPGVRAGGKTSSKTTRLTVILDEEFPFPDEDLRSFRSSSGTRYPQVNSRRGSPRVDPPGSVLVGDLFALRRRFRTNLWGVCQSVQIGFRSNPTTPREGSIYG